MNKKIIALAALSVAFLPMLVIAQDAGDGSSTPWDSLSTYVVWGIAAGFIGSWVMAVVNQTHWPSTAKFVAVFVWCIIASAITAYFKRELDLANWSRSLILVFLASQAMYAAAKPAIKEVEVATTIKKPVVVR